ncbi:MAG: hypothetical protein AVDCRST_MAG96-4124 [uncultured Segetibacter sp.]|uniref:Uncharacterized protein n=1 Tax=uncultured Segetibacter sp. TaxID=481133 RepID=A0A6J4U299_9BACT|nr:MAG: hypothetical protein AVDCRST_MAG96-4124 [uncultured Segetibacter sp.]
MTPLEKMREFKSENDWVLVADKEKHLVYMGDDTADSTEASMKQCWPENNLFGMMHNQRV